jgi:hypothetical protein
MQNILNNNINTNYIIDQIIFNYFDYLLINFDYHKSNDKKIVFVNLILDHYIKKDACIVTIPFKFKLSIKYKDEIGLFTISND